MTPEVTNAIEVVYEAFRDAPIPIGIGACPCCHEPTEYCALTQVPLHELTEEHLSGYVFSVFYTVGDLPDFEYLFPRILELTTASADFGMNREVVFKKPRLAGWPAWRKDRRLAFQNYLDAVVASFGNHAWTDEDDLDSWICSLGFCCGDLIPKLDVFLRREPVATANLLLFYEANSTYLIRHRLSNSFWERGEPLHDQIVLWFAEPAVQKRIQEAYGLG